MSFVFKGLSLSMKFISVILDLVKNPRNVLNAVRLIYTMFMIRSIRPNNSIEIFFNPNQGAVLSELRILLSTHGSDKATKHNYDEFYFRFLSKIKNNRGVAVEIGIGTNNPSIPSSMGVDGIPGASLRSFRDFLPNINVLGADIDREILFSEPRIETFWLDQKNFTSFKPLLNRISGLGGGIDFAVIDGLHQPLTDLTSVRALLPYLKVGAKLFVEDVHPNNTNVVVWRLAERNLNVRYFRIAMHRAKSAYLIEIERHN